MALVPAKCTQCGGNIEVDNTHEAGICQHCGTPFITEKAINNYNTYVTNNFAGANINVMGANVDNLFILAKNAEEVKDFKEANMYYSKILEIEPTNCKALVGKGVSILYSSNLNNVRSDELIGYVSKAVDYKKNDKNADDVIIFSIESAKALYEAAYNIAKVSQNHYYKYWKLESSAPEYWDRLSKVIDILTYVNSLTENSDIKSQKDGLFLYTESLKTIAFLCTEICEQRQYISGITNPGQILEYEEKTQIKPSVQMHQAYLNLYDIAYRKIKEIEPNYEPKEINRETQIKGGCYIATCVYGSYDCPQVWTLRRYRDYTLDETWYGRLFIKCYYTVSPKLVKWFGNYAWFRKPWKKFLDGMVKRLNSEGIADTKYSDKY